MGVEDLLDQGLKYERGGLLDRALERYVQVASGAASRALVSKAWTRISHTHRAACDWDDALQAARVAAGVALSADLATEFAEAVNAEAAVHHSRGDFGVAAAMYELILEETRDTRVRGMALQNLGVIAARQGDLEQAEDRLSAASEAFAAAGDASGEAHVLNSYAAVALDRGDHARAEARGRRALSAARALGDLDLAAIAELNYAEALAGLDRFTEAEAAAMAALGQFQGERNTWRRIECLRLLGRMSEAQERPGVAERFYERALKDAERIGAVPDEADLRERLDRLRESHA